MRTVSCHQNETDIKPNKQVKLLSIIRPLKFILLTTLFCSLTIVSCDRSEVDGVIIEHTLYENLSFSKQIELKKLVSETLGGDEEALAGLTKFWCGGAAGCYDLGFIVTQIIYRIGENKFITMVEKLDKENGLELEGLISVGLEYGDNDKDGKMDNKMFQMEFPKLYKVLTDKSTK